jgi:hypothetical protein
VSGSGYEIVGTNSCATLPTVPKTLFQSAEEYPGDETPVYPEADVRLEHAELDVGAVRFANASDRTSTRPSSTLSTATT